MAPTITVQLDDAVEGSQVYASYVIADALRAAGTSVELSQPLAREALADTALRGAKARISCDNTLSLTRPTVEGFKHLPPAMRVLGAVLLLLVVGSAEIRLAFPPLLDLLVLVAVAWWFWRQTAARR